MKKKEIAKYDYFDIVLGRKILGIVKMADKKQKSDTIRETKYVYDTKNRLVSYTDPEGRTETYTYDCNSNLTKTVDKNGNTLKNTYDNQNRLTERTAKEKKTGKETVHTYRYNAYGDVAVQDDTQFVYGDVSGQVTKETTKLTKNKDVVKNYTYDSKGNKSTFSVKAGEATKLSLSYEYDGSSRLIAVKDSEGNQAVSYAYDMLGRITRETKTGREDISYTYDANNNRKQMTIGNKTTAYQYNKNDELLRTDTLHTDTEKNDVVIYKNDKNGNRLATVNRSEIPAEAKDTSYIDVDVTLGDNQLNDNVVNHYNALNQLTETLTKNYKVSFTYDAEGLRTGKTVNGEKTVYVWDGDQVVMELSKGGAVQKRYIRGNDLVYADKGENTEKTYYVTDMHGNVVQLLDESGNVTKTYEYDSFGNEVKPEKKDENPYRYCGEYYDKETEEVYLRARYYEPGVGRFITRDTYTGESDEPLSLHLYTYCENDGVNMVDPSGHDAIWLQQTDGALGFGHTAVAIKLGDSNWVYYSFSSSKPDDLLGNVFGNNNGKLDVRFYSVDYSKKWKEYVSPKGFSKKSRKKLDDRISSAKAVIEQGMKGGINYDKHIFLEGNFKKSYLYLRKKANMVHQGKFNYSLLKQNCKNLVVDALKKGALKFRPRQFRKCLNKARKKLYPNDAFKLVNQFILSYPKITALRK